MEAQEYSYIGNFDLIREISKGGQGYVYLGQERNSKQFYAVKVIIDKGGKEVELFQKEV